VALTRCATLVALAVLAAGKGSVAGCAGAGGLVDEVEVGVATCAAVFGEAELAMRVEVVTLGALTLFGVGGVENAGNAVVLLLAGLAIVVKGGAEIARHVLEVVLLGDAPGAPVDALAAVAGRHLLRAVLAIHALYEELRVAFQTFLQSARYALRVVDVARGAHVGARHVVVRGTGQASGLGAGPTVQETLSAENALLVAEVVGGVALSAALGGAVDAAGEHPAGLAEPLGVQEESGLAGGAGRLVLAGRTVGEGVVAAVAEVVVEEVGVADAGGAVFEAEAGEAALVEGTAGLATLGVEVELGDAGEAVGGIAAGKAVVVVLVAAHALAVLEVPLQTHAASTLAPRHAVLAVRQGAAAHALLRPRVVVVGRLAGLACRVVLARHAVSHARQAGGPRRQRGLVQEVPREAAIAGFALGAGLAVADPATVALARRVVLEGAVGADVALVLVLAFVAVGPAAQADPGVEVGAPIALLADFPVVGALDAVGVAVAAGDAAGAVPEVPLLAGAADC
jgi:hypothetical protein